LRWCRTRSCCRCRASGSLKWPQLWKEDPIDALCDILIKDKAFTDVAVFGMDEPDVALALKQPWVSIDNDSQGTSPDGLLGSEHPHPRAYGTFPRILRKYVREEHALTLEDAIRKFTSRCRRSGCDFTDRGVLKEGMWADVVIFDPATIRDLATFEQPNQLSQGMDLRPGQRCSGDRGWKDDGSAAGQESFADPAMLRIGLSGANRAQFR
jgi:N-acyl-D-aspartate/D-glutamate deacylase